MKKTELVAAIAAKADISKKDAESAVNAFIDVVTETIKSGDKVSLVGFGTFETRGRSERTGINPRTGASITIAATKVPAFKAGKALKDAVAK